MGGLQAVPPRKDGECLPRSYRRAQSSDDNIQKFRPGGAVAQLGARLDGIEEVVGSNPIGSTKDTYVRSGEILYGTFRRHSLHFWTKRVV